MSHSRISETSRLILIPATFVALGLHSPRARSIRSRENESDHPRSARTNDQLDNLRCRIFSFSPLKASTFALVIRGIFFDERHQPPARCFNHAPPNLARENEREEASPAGRLEDFSRTRLVKFSSCSGAARWLASRRVQHEKHVRGMIPSGEVLHRYWNSFPEDSRVSLQEIHRRKCSRSLESTRRTGIPSKIRRTIHWSWSFRSNELKLLLCILCFDRKLFVRGVFNAGSINFLL